MKTTRAFAAMILMIGLAAPALAGAVNGDDVDDLSWGQLTLSEVLMLGPEPDLAIVHSGGLPIRGLATSAASYCIVGCTDVELSPSFIFRVRTIDQAGAGPNLRFNPTQSRRSR